MRLLTLIILASLIVTLPVNATPACDCFDYPEHLQAFREAKTIFIGQVVKIDENAARPEGLKSEVSYAITFKVEKSWKGAKHSNLIAWEHAEHTFCSRWQFKVGEKYLVYAKAYEGHLIVSGFCSRTRPLETNDATTLKEFKELNSPEFLLKARRSSP